MRALLFIFSLVLLAAVGLHQDKRASAQTTENRAGLVVQGPDDTTQTFCIAFEGDTISGLDLLVKSGLPLESPGLRRHGCGSMPDRGHRLRLPEPGLCLPVLWPEWCLLELPPLARQQVEGLHHGRRKLSGTPRRRGRLGMERWCAPQTVHVQPALPRCRASPFANRASTICHPHTTRPPHSHAHTQANPTQFNRYYTAQLKTPYEPTAVRPTGIPTQIPTMLPTATATHKCSDLHRYPYHSPTSTPATEATATSTTTPPTQSPTTNPEGTARAIGLVIAAGVGVALAVWGAVTLTLRLQEERGGIAP